MPQNISLKIPEKLQKVFEGEADYRGAYGGRGGAKTIAFAQMAIKDIMFLNDEPWIFLCGRELQKSLKDSVFSVISSQITKLGVEEAFEVGRNFIRCKNGNEFLFYGLRSNIAEVKGLSRVRRTWLEEAQSVSEASLTYLIPTVMRDFDDCEIWASWNPDDEEDPIHEMMVANADDSVKCVKINYYDNPWFPDSLDKVRLRDKKNRPDKYGWIWLGNFNINTEASVYGKWINQDQIREGVYDPSLPVHTAWDIGYGDDTAIWFFQVTGGEVRVIDFYANNREDIIHYISHVLGREIVITDRDPHTGAVTGWEFGDDIEGAEHRKEYKLGSHYGPHDLTNKLFAAGGRSAYDQAIEVGFRMASLPAVPQQMQIDSARATLRVTWFDDNPRVREGLKALRKYEFEYDEDKKKYSDKPLHNWASHPCDAFETLAQIWRAPKDTPDSAKPKTINEMTMEDLWNNQPKRRSRI